MSTQNKEIVLGKMTDIGRRKVAIIGYNRIGLQVYNRLLKYSKRKINLLGFIDIFDPDNIINHNPSESRYLGKIQNFLEIVSLYDIEYVYVAIDNSDLNLLHKVVGLCNKAHVKYEFPNEINDVIYGQTISQVFRDLDRPWEFSLRQFFDSLFSFIILIVFLPLWIFVTILIKLDSKGPTMFSQERVGKDGRTFRVFKFRTMFTNAEKLSGPVLASKNDPRITRVGRFLRKTRIDEIPQLLNVLIGDMSFIGPRPERPYFVDKYRREIPLYKNRLKIKPGITGLAQVIVGYDEGIEDVKLKLKYDLLYAERKDSLFYNLRIIFKTVWVVLSGQGQ